MFLLHFLGLIPRSHSESHQPLSFWPFWLCCTCPAKPQQWITSNLYVSWFSVWAARVAAEQQAAMETEATTNAQNPNTAALPNCKAQQFQSVPYIIAFSHFSNLSPFPQASKFHFSFVEWNFASYFSLLKFPPYPLVHSTGNSLLLHRRKRKNAGNQDSKKKRKKRETPSTFYYQIYIICTPFPPAVILHDSIMWSIRQIPYISVLCIYNTYDYVSLAPFSVNYFIL